MQDKTDANDRLSIQLKKGNGSSESMFLDTLSTLTGRLHIELRDEKGGLKHVLDVNNIVVTAGKGHIASLLQDRSSVNEMTRMAIGTGSSGPSVGDTDLGAEITTGLSGTRVSITRTNPSATSVLYTATWTPGQATNGAITEAGIFNASAVGPASGTMLARSVFSPIAKAAGDTLSIAWTVTIS